MKKILQIKYVLYVLWYNRMLYIYKILKRQIDISWYPPLKYSRYDILISGINFYNEVCKKFLLRTRLQPETTSIILDKNGTH